MSNLSQFLGGSGGGAPSAVLNVFSQSGTFVASKDGWIRLSAIGAGASGAANHSGSNPRATGGGAGGALIGHTVRVKAGDSFVITVGAPGLGVSASSAAVDGNDGGDTTIVGPGVNVTIQGGKKGRAGNGAGLFVGGEGGGVVGAPGHTGGSGGKIEAVSGLSAAATGGGAVNLFGRLPAEVSAGDLTQAASGDIATGGASPGGRSLDDVTGGGAGIGGSPSMSSPTSGGPNAFGVVSSPSTPPANNGISPTSSLFAPLGGGGSSSSVSAANSPGGASGGVTNSNSGDAGSFAGSGGAAGAATNAVGYSSGSAGLGAGSGGIARRSGTGTHSSGNGGPAIVLIEEL